MSLETLISGVLQVITVLVILWMVITFFITKESYILRIEIFGNAILSTACLCFFLSFIITLKEIHLIVSIVYFAVSVVSSWRTLETILKKTFVPK